MIEPADREQNQRRRRVSRRPLLDLDPELASVVPGDERELARRMLLVATTTLPTGQWEPARGEPEPGHLGLLLAEGLIARRLRVGERSSLELLGPGDVLRPWQEDAVSFGDASWSVCKKTMLVTLDRALATRLSRWPEVMATIVERALRRSRVLAAQVAMATQSRLELRLLALLWQLAERWGERRDGHVVVAIDLTHEALAELAGARRPSVTAAIHRLTEERSLERTSEGWLLRGAAPFAG